MIDAQDLIVQQGQDQLAQAEAENAKLRESLAYKMGYIDALNKMSDMLANTAKPMQEKPSCRRP